MPEQQSLEITPIVEPNEVLTNVIGTATPYLILMAALFIPLALFKKWADGKLAQRGKKSRAKKKNKEPDPITVLCLLVKRLYGAWSNRKNKDKSNLPEELPEWRYPPNDAFYRNTSQERQTPYNAGDFDVCEDEVATERLQYFPRDILTNAEFVFFATLRNVCRDYLYIIPKMGLWALVDHRDNVTAWNKISRKHLDFTLCHPQTMKPLLAIELDDSSHRNPKQRQRDAEKDAILAQAGVPILRVPVARQYDESALRNLISRKIKRN